ncbi:MAG: phytoene/squalene synthase family protein [Candidatus Omnitrophota bacterium]
MILMKNIQRGFKEARKITRNFAKTFYAASFFLPKETRDAAYSVYAICRLSDESVDDLKNPACPQKLDEIRQKIDLAYSGGLPLERALLSFKQTINKYQIPKEYFQALLDGMLMDLAKTRYNNLEELNDYCYKVAGVVGLIMLKIFRCPDEPAKRFAVKLGIAMQMTNILRDVGEDYLRGRIYIPVDCLKQFRVTEEEIARCQVSGNFREMMRYLADKTKRDYEEAGSGIKFIQGARQRLVVTAMKEMYAGILDEIKNNNYDVFSRRACVRTLKKWLIILKIIVKGKYLCA